MSGSVVPPKPPAALLFSGYKLGQSVSADPGVVYFSTHNALADDDEDEALEIEMRELDGSNRTMAITMFPFHDVEMLKRMLIKRLKLSNKITEIMVYYRGSELPNRRVLSSFASVEESQINLSWRIKTSVPSEFRDVRESDIKLTHRHKLLLQEIRAAIHKKIVPKLTLEGTGATYQLFNTRGKPIAMFKPKDEEAFAPFNPRGYRGHLGQKGFREGVVSGEGCIREVAAYLLDAYYGSFSGVPITIPVEMVHPHFCYDSTDPLQSRRNEDFLPRAHTSVTSTASFAASETQISSIEWKRGSLQEFVKARDTSGDYDSRVFCIGDVHKIGILDIRLVNLDRNDGNLLVIKQDDADSGICTHLVNTAFCKDKPDYVAQASLTPDGKPAKYRLIPIDHGLTLPDCLDLTEFDLCWISWPQAHIPFLPEELQYIANLQPDSDAEWIAKKLEIRSDCLRVMQVSTRVLQLGALEGLYLGEIAELLVRRQDADMSTTEKAISSAISQASYAVDAMSLLHNPIIQFASRAVVMDLAGFSNGAVDRSFASSKQTHPPTALSPQGGKSGRASVSRTAIKDVDMGTTSPADSHGDNLRLEKRIVPKGFRIGNTQNDSDSSTDSSPSDKGLSSSSRSAKYVEVQSEDPSKLVRTSAVDGHSISTGSAEDACGRAGNSSGLDDLDEFEGAGMRPRAKTGGRTLLRESGLPSTAKRRGAVTKHTAYSRNHEFLMKRQQVPSLWTLDDNHGNRLPVNWDDQEFTRLFFGALESMLKHMVKEKLQSRAKPNK